MDGWMEGGREEGREKTIDMHCMLQLCRSHIRGENLPSNDLLTEADAKSRLAAAK